MFENLSKIKVQNPPDLIIHQIMDLINSGAIKSGDKLPSERKLADHFGVSRRQVRVALHNLKIYGIIKVLPQGGIIVNGIGMVALEGMLTEFLEIEEFDYISLVETRVLLEKEAARLAAANRSKQDLIEMSLAMHNFQVKFISGDNAVEEDLLFHIKVAEASGNTVLKSLLMIITPDIVKSFNNLQICEDVDNGSTVEEHRLIYEAIADQNQENASAAMMNHLKGIRNFSKKYKVRMPLQDN